MSKLTDHTNSFHYTILSGCIFSYTLEHYSQQINTTLTLSQTKDQTEDANGQKEENGDAANGEAVTGDIDTSKKENDKQNSNEGAESDEDCDFDDIDAALEKEKKKILEVKDVFKR